MIPEFLIKDSKFINNFDTATLAATKVRVSLKEGLADRKEWAFAGYFLIGRCKSADICIQDSHVSDLHTYVYFKDGKWWLQDLKFSNGTIVNGEKISKDHRHPMGALTQLRLGMGGPLLHLNIERVKPLNMPPQQQDPMRNRAGSDKPSPKKLVVRQATSSKRRRFRRYLFVVAPVILIGLVLAIVGSLQKGHQSTGNQKNIQADQSPAEHGERKEKKAIPGFETTSTGVQVKKADRGGQAVAAKADAEANPDAVQEQTAKLYFNAAVKLADNRHWQAALEYCRIVSAIKPAYPQLDMQITRMKSEAANKQTCKTAQDLIDKGQYAEGAAILSNIDSSSVYYTDAGRMRLKAQTRQKQRDEFEKRVAENQKAGAAIIRALGDYKKGEVSAALARLDSVMKTSSRAEARIKIRANNVKKMLKNAHYLYRRGNKEIMDGQLEPASKTLTELLKVDKELLGDQRGLLANGLSFKIADEYGGMAMKAYTERDFPSAFNFSKMSLKFNKRHRKALSVEKMLLEKSKQLYQDGYIIEEYDPEKAREKWLEALKICSPDTDYYQKALLKIGIH
jgi:hypothetical protein